MKEEKKGKIVKAEYNKNYETARNKLIPEAEKYADKKAGAKPAKTKNRTQDDKNLDEWIAFWNFAFNAQMERLMKKVDPLCTSCGRRMW